ncbi:MAG: hypothetical protein ABIJ61_11825 [bacterium]
MRRLIAIILAGMLAAMCLALWGCNDDNGNGPTEGFNAILLQPERLPTLKSGLVYEGWVVNIDEDSTWISSQSFGKFFWDQFNYFFLSPTDTTQIIDSIFTINGNVYDYDAIAITLESFPTDDSPDPSPTIVAFSLLDPARFTKLTFPVGFGDAVGYYLIGTFSDGNYREQGQDVENEVSGIWFINMVSSTEEEVDSAVFVVSEDYESGLDLPVLPDTGFSYEGWVVLNNGDTLSTGKFYLPGFQDYDNSHAITGPIPNFPGEDFLINAPTGVAQYPPDLLSGGKALITLEPNPDNDLARPSNFIVLEKALITSQLKVRVQSEPMANVAVLTFPRVDVNFSSR